jgi:hypothetical protein
MIEDCLKEVGLHAEVANRQSDHARGLYIDFDDGSRFSLWLDAGVSHWHAADGSNHLFPVGVPPWTQAERLSVVQVPILMDKHKPVLAHSEWTKQPRAKDQIS